MQSYDHSGNRFVPFFCVFSVVVFCNLDNLYIDSNGIIHTATAGSTGETDTPSEEAVMLKVFEQIDNIFALTKPKKLVYIALDGLLP